jgi:uncharacterized protein
VTRSSGHVAAVGPLDAALIRRLRDAVLSRVNPRLLILFGSQAKGTATAESDIDLLVVDDEPFSPARSRRRIMGDIRRSLPSGAYPVDVLLFDTSEFHRWKGTTNHVIARALREGVILYERPGAR